MSEKAIECFACNEIIRAATESSSRSSPTEDIGKKKRKKRKRFRLTMENKETDRFYMPSPVDGQREYSNNDQYTPDTPESTSCMLFHIIIGF